MLSNIFDSILTDSVFTGSTFALATITAIICGTIIASTYMIKNRYSKSLVITLVLLPAIVELVIILVNGNLGAGIAVAGAFSLVRFRSTPGSGQEITSIFLAMAVGLATGMGYIGIAFVFTLVISAVNLILSMMNLTQEGNGFRVLKITIPENLDYEGRFEDIFERYLKNYEYEEVRTTNMGSLYKITLGVVLKDGMSSKEMMDELRTRNGNLDISLSRRTFGTDSI
ncbi:MAG: DUF4956 domain-containing protein [Lachnospiraceae bacterium]|nr:DUF4956 domain-containing protein [Lachnospiraceae bacterium]